MNIYFQILSPHLQCFEKRVIFKNGESLNQHAERQPTPESLAGRAIDDMTRLERDFRLGQVDKTPEYVGAVLRQIGRISRSTIGKLPGPENDIYRRGVLEAQKLAGERVTENAKDFHNWWYINHAQLALQVAQSTYGEEIPDVTRGVIQVSYINVNLIPFLRQNLADLREHEKRLSAISGGKYESQRTRALNGLKNVIALYKGKLDAIEASMQKQQESSRAISLNNLRAIPQAVETLKVALATTKKEPNGQNKLDLITAQRTLKKYLEKVGDLRALSPEDQKRAFTLTSEATKNLQEADKVLTKFRNNPSRRI
jgi:hypothetical protein